MARIKLVETFSLLPEGTYIFKIDEVIYEEDFGKVEIKMTNSKGRKHTERFKLLNQLGTNETAMKMFSFFAKTALNDFDREDIDPDELVGKYIELDIIHKKVESNQNPGEYITFVNSQGKRPATGFEDDEDVDDLLK